MCALSALLYADDIVLIAPSAENLQGLIDTVAEWCGKWGMSINLGKNKTPGLIQPISGYHSCRHTLLLEGNLAIWEGICTSMFVIAAAAES